MWLHQAAPAGCTRCTRCTNQRLISNDSARTPSAPTHPSPTARRNHKQRAHEARAKAHKTPAGRGHTVLTACNGCHAAPPATKTRTKQQNNSTKPFKTRDDSKRALKIRPAVAQGPPPLPAPTMRTLAPAVEYQTPKASKTPSPPPQNRSGAPEAMDDFAAIRNRQVLDRATPVTTTAHTRDPFAPHLFVRAWRQRSPHHGHPQRVPSRSLRPLTSRLISVQPVLGSELQSFQQLCGAPAAFFCARAQVACGVAWRVACGVFRAPKPPWA